MRDEQYYHNSAGSISMRLGQTSLALPRKTVVGIILMVALFAFEIFNFDTTRYALRDLLGDVRFAGLQWAAILAIAFCSIDFAGLVRLFTPHRGEQVKEVWYLMGAWLLGATMNAIMTWWAVSLTLLRHDFGNEVLSRDQLLNIVPIFVAVLVWLTRILFIGAFSVAGEHMFDLSSDRAGTAVQPGQAPMRAPQRAPQRVPQRVPQPAMSGPRRSGMRPVTPQMSDEVPGFLNEHQPSKRPAVNPQVAPPPQPEPGPAPAAPQRSGTSRVRQRPPMPNGVRRTPLGGVQARPRDRH